MTIRAIKFRFGLKTTFAAVAVVATSCVYLHELSKLLESRNAFLYSLALRQVGRNHLLDVLTSSEQLYATESATFWIRENKAKSNQIERLGALMKDELARRTLLGSPESQERLDAELDRVREELRRLTTAPSPAK